MPFQLPTVKDLVPDKGAVLALAAQVLPTMLHTEGKPDLRARMAAYRAYEEHVTRGLAEEIEHAISNVLATHEMMEGERADAADAAAWDAGLDAAMSTELAAVRAHNPEGFEKFALGVRLDQVGRPGEVAKDLGLFVAKTAPYSRPLEDHGKALSAVGIVKTDIAALAALVPAETPPGAPVAAPAAVEAPEAPEAPPAPPVAPVAALPPAVETIETLPDAIDMRPPPTVAEVGKAYKLMYQSSGPDAVAMAKRLNISRNTFVNWCTGKTKPTCTPKDAAYLRAYCEKAAADLAHAGGIFDRVR